MYDSLPIEAAFEQTMYAINHPLDVTLTFVSIDEIFQLNNQLRMKPSPTDVISLPHQHCMGEIFICPPFITGFDNINNRIVHLFVHSLLHLAGYLHDTDEQFYNMSQLEIKILAQLKIGDPYDK